jgi:hypothetical protein
MNKKLISRLIRIQWVIVALVILLFLYLARWFPETVVVRDNAATAAQIESASSFTELKQIAGSLRFLGHGATIVSENMFSVVTLALALFFVLSVLNLWLLRKLKKLHNED